VTPALDGDAGPGPLADGGTGFLARVEREPVAAEGDELSTALSTLASLLLDVVARGVIPTPMSSAGRPDEAARRAPACRGEAA
jgi:hypothetical protein